MSMDVESLSLPFIFSTSVSKYTDCHLQRVPSASGMQLVFGGGFVLISLSPVNQVILLS